MAVVSFERNKALLTDRFRREAVKAGQLCKARQEWFIEARMKGKSVEEALEFSRRKPTNTIVEL